MTMYAITAAINSFNDDGWISTRPLPTFYLDSNIQGIVDEDHATKIAHDILDRPNHTVHCQAIKL